MTHYRELLLAQAIADLHLAWQPGRERTQRIAAAITWCASASDKAIAIAWRAESEFWP